MAKRFERVEAPGGDRLARLEQVTGGRSDPDGGEDTGACGAARGAVSSAFSGVERHGRDGEAFGDNKSHRM